MTAHPLAPGTRVRHYGHQYGAARRNGTATIVEVRPHRDLFEYAVEQDGDDQLRWWSSTVTIAIPPGKGSA